MATLNLTKSTTVAALRKEFNEAFGAQIRLYNGNKKAEMTDTLESLNLTKEDAFECRRSLTVASFIKQMAQQYGLKVKVFTCDDWVAVLDGLTLASAGKVKKNAVMDDMETMLAYQRTATTVENVEKQKNEMKEKEVKTDPGNILGKQTDEENFELLEIIFKPLPENWEDTVELFSDTVAWCGDCETNVFADGNDDNIKKQLKMLKKEYKLSKNNEGYHLDIATNIRYSNSLDEAVIALCNQVCGMNTYADETGKYYEDYNLELDLDLDLSSTKVYVHWVVYDQESDTCFEEYYLLTEYGLDFADDDVTENFDTILTERRESLIQDYINENFEGEHTKEEEDIIDHLRKGQTLVNPL